MNANEIRKYWDDRGARDTTAQSTTQDIYLREIEFEVLCRCVSAYRPSTIADVGCGDGRTTTRLAEKHSRASFTGFDYSTLMIQNARNVAQRSGINNVAFSLVDVCSGIVPSFDLIYTTRCLINLPSWNLQKRAISNIHEALVGNGVYIMVENFLEGHNAFNEIRSRFGLASVAIREHNCLFERPRLLEYLSGLFAIEDEVNISSTYYLVTRVIYSRLCLQASTTPDYFDEHHRLAASLPFCGEFGPVRMLCLRKR